MVIHLIPWHAPTGARKISLCGQEAVLGKDAILVPRPYRVVIFAGDSWCIECLTVFRRFHPALPPAHVLIWERYLKGSQWVDHVVPQSGGRWKPAETLAATCRAGLPRLYRGQEN